MHRSKHFWVVINTDICLTVITVTYIWSESADAVLKEQESKYVEPDLSPSEQVQQAMHCLPLGQETVLSDPASNFHRWTIQDYSRAYSSGITTPLKVYDPFTSKFCVWRWFSIYTSWIINYLVVQVAERFIAMVKESTTGSVEMSFFINHYVEDILRQATESTLRYERGTCWLSFLIRTFTFPMMIM